jgi:hypothetical protein
MRKWETGDGGEIPNVHLMYNSISTIKFLLRQQVVGKVIL